jgi:hypothetical protein
LHLYIDFLKSELDFLTHVSYAASDDPRREAGAMTNEWHELTDLTGDREFVITSVRLERGGVSVSGEFELPPLARLRYEDQVFVSEFLRSHGSIKDMEKAFGVSYPTVKNRLNRIAEQLNLVQAGEPAPVPLDDEDVIALLERGEISADEATARLRR